MHVLLAYLVWGIFSMPVLNFLLTDCSSGRCSFIGGYFTKMWSYPVIIILFFLEKFFPCYNNKNLGNFWNFFKLKIRITFLFLENLYHQIERKEETLFVANCLHRDKHICNSNIKLREQVTITAVAKIT
jgi:hypothetical protein